MNSVCCWFGLFFAQHSTCYFMAQPHLSSSQVVFPQLKKKHCQLVAEKNTTIFLKELKTSEVNSHKTTFSSKIQYKVKFETLNKTFTNNETSSPSDGSYILYFEFRASLLTETMSNNITHLINCPFVPVHPNLFPFKKK